MPNLTVYRGRMEGAMLLSNGGGPKIELEIAKETLNDGSSVISCLTW